MRYFVLFFLLLVIPEPSSIDSFSVKPSVEDTPPIKASSGIFKWIDDNGLIHFSDEAPEESDFIEIELKEISTFKSVSYATSDVDVGKKVVMYSASWCGACKKAKKYFNRRGIRFTEYDIEKSAKAKRQFIQMGAKGVPVIIVGKKRMNGFSEAGFERLYE